MPLCPACPFVGGVHKPCSASAMGTAKTIAVAGITTTAGGVPGNLSKSRFSPPIYVAVSAGGCAVLEPTVPKSFIPNNTVLPVSLLVNS